MSAGAKPGGAEPGGQRGGRQARRSSPASWDAGPGLGLSLPRGTHAGKELEGDPKSICRIRGSHGTRGCPSCDWDLGAAQVPGVRRKGKMCWVGMGGHSRPDPPCRLEEGRLWSPTKETMEGRHLGDYFVQGSWHGGWMNLKGACLRATFPV